jgi:hypothetical protein
LFSWRELRTTGNVYSIAADGPVLVAVYNHAGCVAMLGWGPSRKRVARLSGRRCDGFHSVVVRGTRVYRMSGGGCSNAGCVPLVTESVDIYRPGVIRYYKRPPYSPWGSEYGNPDPEHKETRRGVSLAFDWNPGTVKLRRLSDGRRRIITAPRGIVDATLENNGLFFAYNRPGDPYNGEGRIVFVPFNELFLG